MTAMKKPIVAQPSETKINLTQGDSTPSPGHTALLPHEKDQSLQATEPNPHPEMKQAHQDVKSGLVDTDARAKDGRPLGSRRRT